MLKINLSELYECKPDEEADVLITEFPKMVEWWLRRSSGFKGGSFAEFRKKFYKKWKKEWEGWHSQHAQTSCLIAYTILQTWRKTGEEPKDFRFRFSVINPRLVRIEGGTLCFSTRIGCIARAKLFPRDQQQKMLLEQAEDEKWHIGQTIVTPEWTVIPFTRYVNLASDENLIIRELFKSR